MKPPVFYKVYKKFAFEVVHVSQWGKFALRIQYPVTDLLLLKMIAPFFLFCSLTALVTADYAIDARINQTYFDFMDKFEPYLSNVSYQVVADLYNSSSALNQNLSLSMSDAYEISTNMTSVLITQYHPIAYRIIYNGGYNAEGKYYIFDNSTKQWHLPNKTAPVDPVDGATLNSRIITQELENAFREILKAYEQAAALSKRGLFGGVMGDELRSILRNIKSDPLQNYRDELKIISTVNEHEKTLIRENIQNAEELLNNRLQATEKLQNMIQEIEKSRSFSNRIKAFEEELSKLENAKKDTQDVNTIGQLSKDEAVLKQEIKRVNDFYWEDRSAFQRFFRTRIRRAVGSFLL